MSGDSFPNFGLIFHKINQLFLHAVSMNSHLQTWHRQSIWTIMQLFMLESHCLHTHTQIRPSH